MELVWEGFRGGLGMVGFREGRRVVSELVQDGRVQASRPNVLEGRVQGV
jgi:hypothetical protein